MKKNNIPHPAAHRGVGWFGGEAAFAAEKRIALVIGEASYKVHPLATAANDAGLIAQTLPSGGLRRDRRARPRRRRLRRALRDFLDKAGASGPETVAFVYFAGLDSSLTARIISFPWMRLSPATQTLACRAARLSDYLKPLAALALKTAVVVLDAAREHIVSRWRTSRSPAALRCSNPPQSAARLQRRAGHDRPGGGRPYGAYAHGLAETIRAGGMPLMQVFRR